MWTGRGAGSRAAGPRTTTSSRRSRRGPGRSASKVTVLPATRGEACSCGGGSGVSGHCSSSGVTTGESGIRQAPAGAPAARHRHPLRRLDRRLDRAPQRVVGLADRVVELEPAPEAGRQPPVPAPGADHAAGVVGVAVGVLPGPDRDLDGAGEVAPTVQQPQQDVGAVQLRVDVELLVDVSRVALGRGVVLVPAALQQLPGLAPRARIGPVPAEHVLDHRPVGAALRHRQPPCLDDLAEAAGAEGLGGHRRHHHPAVDAVAVVHDVTGPPGDLDRRPRLRRGHQPGEVGLDLEVDVVGEGVVVGVARGGRRDAARQVPPRLQVGREEAEAAGRRTRPPTRASSA